MQDCFLCRMMRSSGVTGFGGLLGAGPASLFGLPRGDLVWSAMAGGLLVFVLVQQAHLRKQRH